MWVSLKELWNRILRIVLVWSLICWNWFMKVCILYLFLWKTSFSSSVISVFLFWIECFESSLQHKCYHYLTRCSVILFSLRKLFKLFIKTLSCKRHAQRFWPPWTTTTWTIAPYETSFKTINPRTFPPDKYPWIIPPGLLPLDNCPIWNSSGTFAPRTITPE